MKKVGIKLAVLAACGLLGVNGARATTFDISGSNSVGQTITGTITGAPDLSFLTSIDLNISGAIGPFTIFNGFTSSPPKFLASNNPATPPAQYWVYLSFTGGPTLNDVAQSIANDYQANVADSIATYDPVAICGGDPTCQAFVQQDQKDSIVNDFYIEQDSFSATTTAVATTPSPAAFPLFATGLGALGLFGWRRKRKAQAIAV